MGAKTDTEGGMKKLPYPKSVFLIIIAELCERFCYYGMRTILTLYFVQVLSWSDDTATVVYHVYVMVAYFTPLIGAMLADSWLGKFQTIFYLGVVYCAGCVVLTLAATPPISLPVVAFTLVGLGLIALGTGGIKPCVSAFGADQFKLPEQEVQVASYFALFYFAINSGSLVSTVLTPILREDIKCFDDDHCYSLAFAIPGGLMIFALIIFLLGRPMYNIVEPEGNVVVKVFGAITNSLGRRSSEIRAGRQREHWLDYAEDKYGKRFVAEAKVLMKVLFLYIPVPLFWALFDQQGSRWTLQATRMDGNTGGWVIKPDQLQVLNPLLVLAFIPIFDRGIYPLLAKFNLLKSPLQRLTMGGIFAGVAFMVSGFVELSLEPTYATELKSGESNIHLINALHDCHIYATVNGEQVGIPPNDMHIYKQIEAGYYKYSFDTRTEKGCPGRNLTLQNVNITAQSEVAESHMILYDTNGELKIVHITEKDDMEKSKSGNPKLRFIYDKDNILTNTTLHGFTSSKAFHFDLSSKDGFTPFAEVEPTKYDFYITTEKDPIGFYYPEKLDMKLGAVYVISFVRKYNDGGPDDASNYEIAIHQITKENNVHMLLMIPQYLIMTMGEIMFSITIMDFSYAESPPSMKSVMQSAWLLTVAFGNLIVVIVAEAKIFDKQWKEFMLFAGLMYLDMLLFAYMAYKYEPADRFWLAENEDENKNKDEKEREGHDNPAIENEHHSD